jgi:hypothetical protein
MSICEHRHTASGGHHFHQDFLPLAVKLSRENADAGDVATRERKLDTSRAPDGKTAPGCQGKIDNSNPRTPLRA